MTPHSQNDPETHSESDEGNSGPERKHPMTMCPMAETCKGMTAKPMPKFLLALPGLMFVAVGVLIILIPALLVWFFAAASITIGVMMLIFASFLSKLGERFRRMHS